MSNFLNLNAAQLAHLETLNASGNYPEAYRYLRDVTNQELANQIPFTNQNYQNQLQSLSKWLDVAASINANDGSAVSEYARGHTDGAAGILGRDISQERYQDASDELAQDIIDDVLNKGGLPTPKEIVRKDVNNYSRQFDLPEWTWPGTLGDSLPVPFGLDEDYQTLPEDGNWFDRAKAAAQAWVGTHVGVGRAIADAINDAFNAAQKWVPRRDPLTLDLDGDGLETIGTGTILFDHDGDGVKNGTGWVKPDDGFLVFDRNNNGVIDNGSELFGDSTDLYSGGKAADGFDALAQEDTNGDGKVDSLDANWNSLKVWRDINQDGISQASELFTMEQLGIQGFDVNKTQNSKVLANGNQITDIGSYTKVNGEDGTMGEVSHMADINLADDTFHREFTDEIPLAEGVELLPEMMGSGKLRDLREAASLSPELRGLVEQYSQATTRQGQLALLDQLLEEWAETSSDTKTLSERAAGQYIVNYQSLGGKSHRIRHGKRSLATGSRSWRLSKPSMGATSIVCRIVEPLHRSVASQLLPVRVGIYRR